MARPPKLSKNAVIIVLLLLDIYIFRLNFQRTESLAAVPVPLAEELEELQSQRVHEAADQVQRKVQRMADAEHEHEKDRAAHGHAVGVAERAELVEYARNNAAGEHQRHQTRVREQIAQIPGRAVVYRAENAGDLSEALAGDELSEHEHADADEENDLRSAGHHDENARDHYPPAQIVEQSVRPLAVLELEIDADARAERQMGSRRGRSPR